MHSKYWGILLLFLCWRIISNEYLFNLIFCVFNISSTRTGENMGACRQYKLIFYWSIFCTNNSYNAPQQCIKTKCIIALSIWNYSAISFSRRLLSLLWCLLFCFTCYFYKLLAYTFEIGLKSGMFYGYVKRMCSFKCSTGLWNVWLRARYIYHQRTNAYP